MAMSGPSPVRRAFAEIVRRADPQIDLARAALLIAQEEYPALDIECCLAELDGIAQRVRSRLGPEESAPDALARIAALNSMLFDELGFHGNGADYYDTRNSFLNDVLDRRTGIPITISLVYMEVAARLGLRLNGIGVPGHFILQYPGLAPADAQPAGSAHVGELFIDAYHGGVLLTREECAAHFRRLYGPDFTFSAEYLTPFTRHQILSRLLNNLKSIYLERRDYARAVVVVDRLLLVHPDAVWEFKDRGLLYYRLGAFDSALEDLRLFLERDPDAEDGALIEYFAGLCERVLMMRN